MIPMGTTMQVAIRIRKSLDSSGSDRGSDDHPGHTQLEPQW